MKFDVLILIYIYMKKDKKIAKPFLKNRVDLLYQISVFIIKPQ